MNALKKPPRLDLTIPQFLTWADRQPGRWQLRDGEPEMMDPPAERHGSIQAELGALIRNQLRAAGGRCRVVMTPGVVPHLRSDRNMLVPDIGITCLPCSSDVAMPNPVVLLEILSPSNDAATRANVWAYATIPSVREIILVAGEEIAAEVLRRDAAGAWPQLPEPVGRDGRLVIESIGLDIPLRDAYATTELAD
jgi:Uma2 family endonuclease